MKTHQLHQLYLCCTFATWMHPKVLHRATLKTCAVNCRWRLRSAWFGVELWTGVLGPVLMLSTGSSVGDFVTAGAGEVSRSSADGGCAQYKTRKNLKHVVSNHRPSRSLVELPFDWLWQNGSWRTQRAGEAKLVSIVFLVFVCRFAGFHYSPCR